MTWNQLLQQFSDFYRGHILPGGFEWVVPIETKGMLLLERILGQTGEHTERILSRRAFDFLSPVELATKKVALVDDMLLYGRTMNKSADHLRALGVGQVSKFVFILLENEKSRQFRRVSDTRACVRMEKGRLPLLLEDMCQLSLKDRPSSPDHLAFRIELQRPITPIALVSLLNEYGGVVEYLHNENSICCSVHYPTFAPALPSCASDTGPNKLRLKMGHSGSWLDVCPEFFPSLAMDTRIGELDELSGEVFDAFSRPWHTKEVCAKNLYESFTISVRTTLITNLLSVLDQEGIAARDCSLRQARLPAYYGDSVFRKLADTINRRLVIHKIVSLRKGEIEDKNVQTRDEINFLGLTEDLLRALRTEYEQRNSRRADPYEWESAGLNIDELCRRTGLSKEIVSVGEEHLNDYGYSVPHASLMSAAQSTRLERVYRCTETGESRLGI
jgi:hypothetical protein